MVRRRSPVRVGNCKPWPFPPRPGERRHAPLCDWVCDGSIRGAEFVNRRNPKLIAVLHPSTKKAGQFQLSRFDEDGAIGDVVRPTCNAALKDSGIVPATWKLRSAV